MSLSNREIGLVSRNERRSSPLRHNVGEEVPHEYR